MNAWQTKNTMEMINNASSKIKQRKMMMMTTKKMDMFTFSSWNAAPANHKFLWDIPKHTYYDYYSHSG